MARLAALVFQGVYFLIVLLLALATLPRAGATPAPDASRSLVAIGDVHGDFNDFVAILQRTSSATGRVARSLWFKWAT